MPDLTRTESINRALTPFRRRLRLVAFGEVVPVAVLAWLAAAATSIVGWQTAATLAASITALATIAGLATAWSIAAVRTPSLDRTAEILDLRFSLGNRAATARQFSVDDDEVSRLIVADAQRHLGRVSPEAIPVPRPSAAACGAAAMLALAPALLMAWSHDRAGRRADAQVQHGAQAGVGAIAGGGAVPASPEAAETSAVARMNSPTSTAPAAVAAAAAQEKSLRSQNQTSDKVNQMEGRPASPLGAAPAGSAMNPKATTPPSAAVAAAAAGAPAPGGAATAASRPTASATAAGRSPGSSAATGRDGAAPGTSRSALGGGTASSRAEGIGAGGVANGSISSTARSAVRTDATPIELPATEYRRARQAAESAIANDRVPPRLRAYVRDYFIAIGREAR